MANSTMKLVRPLGYYVHHHGTGHMRRALTICQQISRPVVMFSSQPKPDGLPANVTYIELQSDVVDGYAQPKDSVFHYTPYASQIFGRYQQLIAAWQEFAITELYVDVSVEVAVLAKLYGLRVGQAVMQGDRTDLAHTFGYAAVDYLLAACNPEFDDPAGRNTNTTLHYVGGISRFKKRLPGVINWAADGRLPCTIAVTMSPKAERDMASAVLRSAVEYPASNWHIIGQKIETQLPNVINHDVVSDPETLFMQADIIIGSGGTNTIMEVASLGKPFICIPESRPFDEQLASAKALERLNAGVCLTDFPEPANWPAIMDRLAQLDLAAFSNLVNDGAAAQAANVIERAGKS